MINIININVIDNILVRNVMNHISHHFNLFEATHFVLSGTSAGGFGVRSHHDLREVIKKNWEKAVRLTALVDLSPEAVR